MSDPSPALEAFTAVAMADATLQWELRRAPDRAAFVALVVERSRQYGCALEAATVEAELDRGTHLWRLGRTER